ncbi:MAG: cysteine hydrolase [Tindallia sp. MSAO_Bac2]|nr:MAG: cysteine hydrolase [Tindallia sp. MSAO_Bac2]
MDCNNSKKQRRALLLIDYTVDFVADDGKLPVGDPGQRIENAIAEKIETTLNSGDYLFIINDLHEEKDLNHPEHKLFPPHNLKGSSGRNLYGSIHPLVSQMENKHYDQIHWMDKRRYSAFCGTPLELILRQEKIEVLELAGVCTDICVLHTAIDAYNKGFQAIVDEKMVASFNEEAHRVALEHIQNVLGFKVNKTL